MLHGPSVLDDPTAACSLLTTPPIVVSKCIFRVHNVSQWPNLRHLAEPIVGAVGLLEAMCFKEATESVCRGRTTDDRG